MSLSISPSADGLSAALQIGGVDALKVSPNMGAMCFRNKIINGDMRIDQRNAGAAVTTGYPVDRFTLVYGTGTLTAQRSTTIVPPGFGYSLGVTVTSAGTRLATDYPSLVYKIEGSNVIDLALGGASAKTVTLSFWIRSSLTGTFGGVLASGDNNRSYGFSYTINSANTWEQKTVTVSGDTSGGSTAYPIDNTTGLYVKFDLGAGSNYQATVGSWNAQANRTGISSSVSFAQTAGATFYLTGVQLEAGSVATPFEHRPIGTELALCQRYYCKVIPDLTAGVGFCPTTTQVYGNVAFQTPMRVSPTAIEQSGTATNYRVRSAAGGTVCSAVPTFVSGSPNSAFVIFVVASGLTAGQGCFMESNLAGAYLGWSAEL